MLGQAVDGRHLSDCDGRLSMKTFRRTEQGDRRIEIDTAHGMRQKGGTIYREETNVPMFIAHPDGVRGVTTDAVMSSVDIAPTLLGFAGKDAAAKKAQEPAELVKFEPTLKVNKAWSVNLGKGERRIGLKQLLKDTVNGMRSL